MKNGLFWNQRNDGGFGNCIVLSGGGGRGGAGGIVGPSLLAEWRMLRKALARHPHVSLGKPANVPTRTHKLPPFPPPPSLCVKGGAGVGAGAGRRQRPEGKAMRMRGAMALFIDISRGLHIPPALRWFPSGALGNPPVFPPQSASGGRCSLSRGGGARCFVCVWVCVGPTVLSYGAAAGVRGSRFSFPGRREPPGLPSAYCLWSSLPAQP